MGNEDVSAPLAELEGLRERCLSPDGGCDVLRAVSVCALHGLVMPPWLADAFVARRARVADAFVGSWDEAFGRPWPKGTKLALVRQKRLLRSRVHAAVWKAVDEDRSRPIKRILFDEIGEQPGICKSGATTERLYYEALAQGAVNVADWRAALGSGDEVLTGSRPS